MFEGSQDLLASGQAKPKVRKRKPAKRIQNHWSAADESQLIAEIEQYSCLYDAGCEDNKNKNQREAAWNLVASAFSERTFSSSECQAKWNSLRGTHRRLLKSQKQPSGEAVAPKPTWPHFSSMSFIVRTAKKNDMLSESNLMVIDLFVVPISVSVQLHI